MENYKELLMELYKEHAPEKLDQIDFYLERYKGKEKQFYVTQKAKYANKKSVKDSKKILEEAMARINKKKESSQIKKPHIEVSTEPEKEAKTTKHNEPEKKAEKPENKKADKVIPEPVEKLEDKKEKIVKEVIEKEKPKAVVNSIEEIKQVPVTPEKIEEKAIEEKDNKKPDVIIQEPVITKKEAPIAQKPVSSIKEEKPKEAEPDKDKIKQDNWKREKERLEQSKADFNRKDKNKTPILGYIGAAALIVLIVAIAVWFLHFRDIDQKKEEPINVQKVKLENTDVSTNDQTKAEVQDQEKNKDKTAANSPTEEIKPEPKKEKTEAVPKPKKKETSSQTRPTQERIYARDIDKPAIFVGCFATKTESQAQKKVAVLKQQGLDAHYYWIPDLEPKGNSYFKVVAGPFNTITEAYPSLTKAQERVNFDSYILIVK